MKPIVYISGPISNMPDLNRPAFTKAADSLRASGYDVVNPFDVSPNPATWEEAMRADIKALCDCHRIAMLPGYENSRGACLELTIAKALGMEITYLGEPAVEGGIYAIVGPNGRLYVGQTWSFKRRWMEHRSALRGNRHHCVALQRAWNKHGADAFEFAPMFVAPPGLRDHIEQSWFDAVGRSLYNSALDVMSPQRGRKHSAQTRAKMAAAKAGPKNCNFGKVMTEEQKQKISASHLGKYRGEKSPNFGKPKTPEHRAKLSEALRGKLVGERNPVACPVRCLDTGVTFPTFAAAAEWLRANGKPKADLSSIRKAAHGKTKSAYGFQWALGMKPIFLTGEA